MSRQIEIPEWMMQEESYMPLRDKNAFMKKSSGQILKILAKIKMQTALQGKKEISAGLGLLLMLTTVVLTVSAENLLLPGVLLGGMVVVLAFLDGVAIKSILKEVLAGMLFAVLFTLPAAWFGNFLILERMVLKTAVTVMAVALLNHKVRWNRMSMSLHRLHIPDTLLFVFDMMIKYLVVLGRVCGELMDALRLRSIGKNEQKGQSAAGVLGITYLKSQHMAEETYLAMHCRGFDGTYHYYGRHTFQVSDMILLLLLVLEILLKVMIK